MARKALPKRKTYAGGFRVGKPVKPDGVARCPIYGCFSKLKHVTHKPSGIRMSVCTGDCGWCR